MNRISQKRSVSILHIIDYINYILECHSTYVQGIGYLLSRKGYFQGMSSSVLHRTISSIKGRVNKKKRRRKNKVKERDRSALLLQ